MPHTSVHPYQAPYTYRPRHMTRAASPNLLPKTKPPTSPPYNKWQDPTYRPTYLDAHHNHPSLGPTRPLKNPHTLCPNPHSHPNKATPNAPLLTQAVLATTPSLIYNTIPAISTPPNSLYTKNNTLPLTNPRPRPPHPLPPVMGWKGSC